MSADKVTAIVVGAGPAGSIAAYVLAKAGVDVVLVERGSSPGEKNVFGGRMYSHVLNRILPGFWEEAPVERAVVREVVTALDGARATSVVCEDLGWADADPPHSFTLLRVGFDAWLAAKAEEAGALLACGIRVDDVLMEGGGVTGIRAGEDEMAADVVIAADGANALLAQKAGLAKVFEADQVATGIKQVIEMPRKLIEDRFQLEEDWGAAQLFLGDCTRGMRGGGFLYTNKDSVSLGLVVKSLDLRDSQIAIADLLEDFKANPHIANLIEGGEPAEYSAHLVPEAGLEMMPRLSSDGMLVVGDAAGMALNLGFMVRGMDLAMASGEAAAFAVIEAKARGDFSRSGLGQYEDLLKKGLVMSSLQAYRGAPAFLDNPRIFDRYPKLMTGLTSRMFTVDGSPPQHLGKMIRAQVKESGMSLGRLAYDAWKGLRSL